MLILTCIIALCFAIFYNFINYTDFPKYYIVDKYNRLMKFDYELQLNSLMNNTELKEDMKNILKNIFLFSSLLDFDAFVENKELFKKKYDEIIEFKELNKIVNQINITNIYLKYNISQNYYRDIYFNNFNLINTNKLQIIINDLFLKNIFDINEKFFKTFNKQLLLMNINKDDLLSKKILDKIYFNILDDSEFYNSLIQFETSFNSTEILNKLNKLDNSYYCVKLINNSCPDFLDLFIKDNDFLNIINNYSSKHINTYSNKCCNYD